MTRAFADQVAGWRYPPPFDTYDVDGPEVDHLLRPDYRYQIVWEGETGIGYCCFGADARVPGGDYSSDALDVGWGMRPDLTGHGHGRAFVGAIVEFALDAYRPAGLRVTIAEFNTRSQRAAASGGGFTLERDRFTAADGMRFIILERDPGPN